MVSFSWQLAKAFELVLVLPSWVVPLSLALVSCGDVAWVVLPSEAQPSLALLSWAPPFCDGDELVVAMAFVVVMVVVMA